MKLINDIKKKKIDKIRNALYADGSNRNTIKNALKDVKNSNMKEEETIDTAVIAYIKGISERIGKILNRYKIHV